MSRDDNNWLGGALIGAIVGLVAGILLAPKSGRETRDALRRRGQQAWDDAEATINRTREQLSERIDNLRSVAGDLAGEAREESQELIKRAESLKQDLVSSAKTLGRKTGAARDTAVTDVKRLVGEGGEVMSELERLTKKLVGSTKSKLKSDPKTEA